MAMNGKIKGKPIPLSTNKSTGRGGRKVISPIARKS